MFPNPEGDVGLSDSQRIFITDANHKSRYGYLMPVILGIDVESCGATPTVTAGAEAPIKIAGANAVGIGPFPLIPFIFFRVTSLVVTESFLSVARFRLVAFLGLFGMIYLILSQCSQME